MHENNIYRHDVLVIGGGLAGLRAAIEAHDCGADTAVVSKVYPLRSHSVAAQGGINAALGNSPRSKDDSWKDHAFDTIKGSVFLADQDAVEILCREASGAVIELEHWGTVFSRDEEGKLAQRPFGGAGVPRTCYAADRTGHNLLNTLFEQANARGVSFYNEQFVTSLIVNEGVCRGCITIDICSGELHGFASGSLILATGGHGRIYNRSTNSLINTADGQALAYRCGAALKDMEFVQFHPTTLYGSNILITEGARGEGAYLLNSEGDRFMPRYAPEAEELAPRDIVARAIMQEIKAGRGFDGGYVHLDLRHLGAEKINERLPGIRQIALDFADLDPVEEPVPVQPGQHYSMGGIDVDIEGKTAVPGLYAVGECACVSVHGANRLGGNSLLEAVVFGKITGKSAATGANDSRDTELKAALKRDQSRLSELSSGRGEGFAALMREMRSAMFDNFGIFRDEEKMGEGLKAVEDLQKRYKAVRLDGNGKIFNLSLIRILELGYMLDTAETVALSSIERKESRGSHYRTDFPDHDDGRYLKHTIIKKGEDRRPSIAFSPVKLGLFPLKEDGY
jgi:succinate dehydrogenase / fumarate reductase, flavoprotein subunit